MSASWAGGCTFGSLATNTGPCPPEHYWSDARRQQAHVGEQVQFDFVLVDMLGRFVNPTGLADYCVVRIADKRLEIESSATGHFQFDHLFEQAAVGGRAEVRVTAYRQRKGRDFVNVHGQWLESGSPYEISDQKVASDKVLLTFYQATVELAIAGPPDDLTPETGVLRIRRKDAATTSIYIDRPGRPGFTLAGPGPDGYYRLSYRLAGGQPNPTGTTDIEFTIYDTAGQQHEFLMTLGTP